jgi:hypothetical protein
VTLTRFGADAAQINRRSGAALNAYYVLERSWQQHPRAEIGSLGSAGDCMGFAWTNLKLHYPLAAPCAKLMSCAPPTVPPLYDTLTP